MTVRQMFQPCSLAHSSICHLCLKKNELITIFEVRNTPDPTFRNIAPYNFDSFISGPSIHWDAFGYRTLLFILPYFALQKGTLIISIYAIFG